MKMFVKYFIAFPFILRIKSLNTSPCIEPSEKLDKKFCAQLIVDFTRYTLINAKHELNRFKNKGEKNLLINKGAEDREEVLVETLVNLFNNPDNANIDYYSFVPIIDELSRILKINNYIRKCLKIQDITNAIPCEDLNDFFDKYMCFKKGIYCLTHDGLENLINKIQRLCNSLKTTPSNIEKRRETCVAYIEMMDFYSNILKLIIIDKIDKNKKSTELKIDDKELNDVYCLIKKDILKGKSIIKIGNHVNFNAEDPINKNSRLPDQKDHKNNIKCQLILSNFKIIKEFIKSYYPEKKKFSVLITELEKILIYKYSINKNVCKPNSDFLKNLHSDISAQIINLPLKEVEEHAFFDALLKYYFNKTELLFIKNESFTTNDIKILLCFLANIDFSNYCIDSFSIFKNAEKSLKTKPASENNNSLLTTGVVCFGVCLSSTVFYFLLKR